MKTHLCRGFFCKGPSENYLHIAPRICHRRNCAGPERIRLPSNLGWVGQVESELCMCRNSNLCRNVRVCLLVFICISYLYMHYMWYGVHYIHELYMCLLCFPFHTGARATSLSFASYIFKYAHSISYMCVRIYFSLRCVCFAGARCAIRVFQKTFRAEAVKWNLWCMPKVRPSDLAHRLLCVFCFVRAYVNIYTMYMCTVTLIIIARAVPTLKYLPIRARARGRVMIIMTHLPLWIYVQIHMLYCVYLWRREHVCLRWVSNYFVIVFRIVYYHGDGETRAVHVQINMFRL